MNFRTYGPGPQFFRFGTDIVDITRVTRVIRHPDDEDGAKISFWMRDDNTENALYGEEGLAFWNYMTTAAFQVYPPIEPDPEAMPF